MWIHLPLESSKNKRFRMLLHTAYSPKLLSRVLKMNSPVKNQWGMLIKLANFTVNQWDEIHCCLSLARGQNYCIILIYMIENKIGCYFNSKFTVKACRQDRIWTPILKCRNAISSPGRPTSLVTKLKFMNPGSTLNITLDKRRTRLKWNSWWQPLL